MPRIIIDVSSNNARPIDWATLKADGVYGVMVKATEGCPMPGHTEKGYVNPDFGTDYNAAAAAGLAVGAYHFWHPELPVGLQLQWFHQHYGARLGDLPPWWDSEINPTARSWEDLAREMATVAFILTATYGDAHFYVNRAWRDGLAGAGVGWPYNRGITLAEGVAADPADQMQFSPRKFPGLQAPFDWSAG